MTTTPQTPFHRGNWLFPVLLAACGAVFCRPALAVDESPAVPPTPQLRGALITAKDAAVTHLHKLAAAGTNIVVFKLSSSDHEAKQVVREAVGNAQQTGLNFAYWVEVARSPELAEEHPEWMASLQTHDEWRRYFPDFPELKADEVAKTFPWVPILSREPFEAQKTRVVELLANLPTPKAIFLNDLQGAPSACGCGHPLCRWTSDYGTRRSVTPLGDDAAALFVDAIQQSSPTAEVIPVWAIECEEHDGSADGLCGGVGCFKGICWKAYTKQLMPVAEQSQRLGVLALYKEFQRDISLYGTANASWVEFAVKTFETMPPQHKGRAVPTARIVAILQGWDVTAAEIKAQQSAATKSGANGYVIAYDKLDQSWSPKVVSWK